MRENGAAMARYQVLKRTPNRTRRVDKVGKSRNPRRPNDGTFVGSALK